MLCVLYFRCESFFVDGCTAAKLMYFFPVMYLNWACLANTKNSLEIEEFEKCGFLGSLLVYYDSTFHFDR